MVSDRGRFLLRLLCLLLLSILLILNFLHRFFSHFLVLVSHFLVLVVDARFHLRFLHEGVFLLVLRGKYEREAQRRLQRNDGALVVCEPKLEVTKTET